MQVTIPYGKAVRKQETQYVDYNDYLALQDSFKQEREVFTKAIGDRDKSLIDVSGRLSKQTADAVGFADVAMRAINDLKKFQYESLLKKRKDRINEASGSYQNPQQANYINSTRGGSGRSSVRREQTSSILANSGLFIPS